MIRTWKKFDENTADMGGITLRKGKDKNDCSLSFENIPARCAVVVSFEE